jgi:hypothetical protein
MVPKKSSARSSKFDGGWKATLDLYASQKADLYAGRPVRKPASAG